MSYGTQDIRMHYREYFNKQCEAYTGNKEQNFLNITQIIRSDVEKQATYVVQVDHRICG